MNADKRGSLLLCAMLLGCAGQTPAPESAPPGATEQTQPAPVAAAAPVAPAAAATPAAVVPTTPQDIVVKGFSTPESVLYDAATDGYLVSNINGAPADADDNGFISKLSPEGTITELKWIDGAKDNIKLNAPKGMAISNGVLYVSDIDTVRKFDAKTGEPKGEIKIKGAMSLNDLAVDSDGTVYVSDTGVTAKFEPAGGDQVFKIVKDKVKSVIKSKDLKGPNGLFVDGDKLWVVTFAGNELYDVKTGKKADTQALPKGQLDGIAKTNDGTLLVTSWEAKQVFARPASGGEWKALVSDVNGPADIGYDSKRNRLLIPVFMDSEVRIVQL